MTEVSSIYVPVGALPREHPIPASIDFPEIPGAPAGLVAFAVPEQHAALNVSAQLALSDLGWNLGPVFALFGEVIVAGRSDGVLCDLPDFAKDVIARRITATEAEKVWQDSRLFHVKTTSTSMAMALEAVAVLPLLLRSVSQAADTVLTIPDISDRIAAFRLREHAPRERMSDWLVHLRATADLLGPVVAEMRRLGL